MVAYVALTRLTQDEPHLDITLDRTAEYDSIYEAEEGRFTLRVKNNGPEITWLELFDELPSRLRISGGSNRILTTLKQGETKSFSYSLDPKVFGSYEVGPLHVRTSDLAGGRVQETVVDSRSRLSVYPDIRYVSRMSIGPERPKYWPGETVARRAGYGMDYYGIKEYVVGDSLRRVNWKASSRSDETLINKYLDEAGGDILLVLDARSCSELGTPPDSILTQSTRAAAALAYRLLRDRNRVGLIGIGRNLVSPPPGFGRRQFEKILASLLALKPGEGWEIENLPMLLSLRFSRQVQVVLISPLMDDRAQEAVVGTANSGYHVVLLSPSPIDFEKARNPTGVDPLAEKLARLRREAQLHSLRRHAVIIDWNTTEPLEAAVYRFAEAVPA